MTNHAAQMAIIKQLSRQELCSTAGNCQADDREESCSSVGNVKQMSRQESGPLQCDDEFISKIAVEKEGIKIVFHQYFYRASDLALCFRGRIELVCLINGKLGVSEEYEHAILGV